MTTGNRSDGVARFYLSRTDGEPNLFEIWERGEGRGDSVTPSTYSPEYRRWIRDRLVAEIERTGGPGLLSLGCGNAMVEAEVVGKGFRVLAVDVMQEAVELARAKAVEATRADITSWEPRDRWPVIYMDGLAGHLHDPSTGLRPVLTRIRSWLQPVGSSGIATLVISNDVPRDGSAAQPAPGVPGFYWLSAECLREEALASGFDEVTTEEVAYRRPHSGDRIRAVVFAHVHG